MSANEAPPDPLLPATTTGRLRLPIAPRIHQVGWRSALREFVLIVAGVLVALGANSWWESRQDLGRERAYMIQLRSDLVATLELIDNAVISQDASLRRLKRMEHLMHSSGDTPPTDSLLAWAPATGALRYVPGAGPTQFIPIFGTLNMLLETGDIRLIRDDNIRMALISYAASIKAGQVSAEGLQSEYIARTSRARWVLEPYIVYQPARWQDTTVAYHSFDIQGMRRDSELRAGYFDLVINRAASLNNLSISRQQTEKLLSALENGGA